MEKKLHKSSTNRMLAGVCGGVAEYLDIDPTVVRAIWAVSSIFAFAGVIAYIACAIIIPEA